MTLDRTRQGLSSENTINIGTRYCRTDKNGESPVGNQQSPETAIHSTSNGAQWSMPPNVRVYAYERESLPQIWLSWSVCLCDFASMD